MSFITMEAAITLEGSISVPVSARRFLKFVVTSHAKSIDASVERVRCPSEHAGERCPVCLHTFYRCEKVCMLPCGHVVCEVCLGQSLDAGMSSCAVCREPVTLEPMMFTIVPKTQD